MKKKISSVAFALIAATIMSLASNSAAYAAELTDSKLDGSGNYYSAGEVVNTSENSASHIENECFVAGQTVNIEDTVIDGSAFAAGANINIKDSVIGSSIFAAGSDVSIDATANNNIWVFGANVKASESTSVKGLHAAGANINIEGDYKQVDVCGSTVIFNATVDGDVNIEAENVTIGKNAEVTGDLNITYSKEFDNEAGDKISNLNVTKVETEESAEEAAKNTATSILGRKAKMALYMLFANSIIALLLSLLFNSSLTKAYEYCTKRTGAFIGFGALTAIMAPTAIFLTMLTFIGLPTAGLAFMVFATVGFGCKVFTFGSLVRELIFTHTSKRLHPIAETVIAVLPLAILRRIPVVSGLVGLLCAIYTWGYIVLALYDRLSAEKKARLESVVAEEKTDQ